MAVAFAVTAESSVAAESSQEEDELRPRTRCVGGPMFLWHAPGNIGQVTNQVS